MDINEFQKIFEYEIKRKLAQKFLSPQEELRKLINSFKFYDYTSSFVLDKNQWVKGVLKTGLCGFNINDLAKVFENYDPNKTGYINYINFCNYLYGKEKLMPLTNNPNESINKNTSNKINNEFDPPGLYERNLTPNKILKIKTPNQTNIQNNQQIENNINIPKENYHNINNINNNNIIEKTDEQINSLNKNINENEAKNYFNYLINVMRNEINKNNGLTFYTFAYELKIREDKATKSINFENFADIVQKMGFKIQNEDLIEFFKIFDYTQTNKAQLDEIIRIMKGNITEERRMLVITKFSEMDVDKKGIIPVDLVKNLYNAKFHPDVFLKKKNADDVYDEFMFTFNTFCLINDIKDQISYKDFVDYYTPISSAITNNNYFDDIIYGVWNFEQMNKETNNINDINVNNIPQQNEIKVKTPQNIIRENTPRFTPYTNNINSQKEFSSLNDIKRIQYNPINNIYFLPKNKQNNNNINNFEYNNNMRNGFDLVNKLRELLVQKGPKSIFIIQRMLFIYDVNKSGEIIYDKLYDIFDVFGVKISKEDIYEIFNMLDKGNQGIIKYTDLINLLINDISKKREVLIQKLFEKLKNQNNLIALNELRNKFNPNNHPDVLKKFKNRNEVLYEYLDSIEIFKEYNDNLSNKNIINGFMDYEDFFTFFKEISLGINNDNFFEFIINNCWN